VNERTCDGYERASPKRRMNLFVGTEQWAMLHAIRQQTGAPIAELVRRAISEYLLRHGPWQSSVEPSWESERRDTPVSSDVGAPKKKGLSSK
jgi:hypothetical protein